MGETLERLWVAWAASLLGVGALVCVYLAWALENEDAIDRGLTAALALGVAGTGLGVAIRRRPLPDGRPGDPTALVVGVCALVLCGLSALLLVGLAGGAT